MSEIYRFSYSLNQTSLCQPTMLADIFEVLVYTIYKLPHELPNDVSLRKYQESV